MRVYRVQKKYGKTTQTTIGELARNDNYLYHNTALISTYCVYHKMGEERDSTNTAT